MVVIGAVAVVVAVGRLQLGWLQLGRPHLHKENVGWEGIPEPLGLQHKEQHQFLLGNNRSVVD
jgi:hypothetical protein